MAAQKEINLRVGLEMVIKNDTPGKEFRTNARVVGWEGKKIIIVKLVKVDDLQHFSKGTLITVGFIEEGTVHGFNSKILLIINEGDINLLIMQYPETIEVIQLRKEERIKVNFQGSIKTLLDDVTGNLSEPITCKVVDLSTMGCGIVTTTEVDVEKKVFISFQIPLQGKITDLPGSIVNKAKVGGEKFRYGIKFEEDAKQKGIIASYKSLVGILHQS